MRKKVFAAVVSGCYADINCSKTIVLAIGKFGVFKFFVFQCTPEKQPSLV